MRIFICTCIALPSDVQASIPVLRELDKPSVQEYQIVPCYRQYEGKKFQTKEKFMKFSKVLSFCQLTGGKIKEEKRWKQWTVKYKRLVVATVQHQMKRLS